MKSELHWWYRGTKMSEIEQFPKDIVGFVYILIHKPTGLKYIGKKILRRKIRRKPLKGKKRVRIDYVESDWKKYTGSSDVTKKWEAQECERVILHLCKGKKDMTYLEVSEQFAHGVLEDDKFVNKNILNRFFK